MKWKMHIKGEIQILRFGAYLVCVWIPLEEGENLRWRIYLDGSDEANKSYQIWTDHVWTDIRWMDSSRMMDCLNEPIVDESFVDEPRVDEPRVDGPKSHVVLG